MIGFHAAFKAMPLVAILRGVKPDEVEAIGLALVEAGFTLIEVPLNSPDPFDSIAKLVAAIGDRAVIGAGTVLDAAQVERLAAVGGRIVVAPNFDVDVAAAAKAYKLAYLPGVVTPSEGFAALKAGAAALKLFPAEMIPPAAVKAMLAVLPKGTDLLPVGGIDETTMHDYARAGATGFGLGSSVYKPGMTAAAIGKRATALVKAWSLMQG